MSALIEQHPSVESEHERILRWRYLMLLDLGFSLEQTQLLVSVPDLDWHRAEYLLRKGMSHELVVNELT